MKQEWLGHTLFYTPNYHWAAYASVHVQGYCCNRKQEVSPLGAFDGEDV